jgi:hypothetical protein
MKDIVASLGALVMWWVVGYAIQAAARILDRDDSTVEGSAGGRDAETTEPRLVA